MPWKLKYEKDDDMVALDFETKNQLDDYIKSNILLTNLLKLFMYLLPIKLFLNLCHYIYYYFITF